MGQLSRTTRLLFVYALIAMLLCALLLFGFIAWRFINETMPVSVPWGTAGYTDNLNTIHVILIVLFLFSVVFFMVVMNFYVDERTRQIEHKYIHAKEALLKRPLNIARGNVIKLRDYTSIATLSNTKRIPLLKYTFNKHTTFYYLVDHSHLYLFKEYTDSVKRYIEESRL